MDTSGRVEKAIGLLERSGQGTRKKFISCLLPFISVSLSSSNKDSNTYSKYKPFPESVREVMVAECDGKESGEEVVLKIMKSSKSTF